MVYNYKIWDYVYSALPTSSLLIAIVREFFANQR